MVALLAFPSPLPGLCLGFCWSRVHLLRECRCWRGPEISFRPKRALSHRRLGLRLASSLCNFRSGPHLARRNSRISRCADGPRTQHGWPLVKVFGCFCEVFLWTLVWLGCFGLNIQHNTKGSRGLLKILKICKEDCVILCESFSCLPSLVCLILFAQAPPCDLRRSGWIFCTHRLCNTDQHRGKEQFLFLLLQVAWRFQMFFSEF